MTDGARTVALLGPERIFADPGFTAATVTTSTWVRILPRRLERGRRSAALVSVMARPGPL